MNALTPRQKAIIDFLRATISGRGFGPSVREIGVEFGIRSPNGVMCHLKALERKGLISRAAGLSRAIKIEGGQPSSAKLRRAGFVKAGRPTLADEIYEIVDYSDLFDDTFELRVYGTSMAGEGIMPGDSVVVRPTRTAGNGDLVVARADGEQTLKRLRVVEGVLFLVAASPEIEPWSPQTLEIIGVVEGLIRRFR